MCCLLVCKSARPDWEAVQKMWAANDDGAGVGYFNKNGKCEYIKGISSPKETFDLIQKIEFPFVLHFRFKSAGCFSKLLTHPFEVTRRSDLKLKGEANRLLFHNGTVSNFEDLLAAAGIDKPKNEPCSDTRAVAMIVSHNNEKFLRKINGKFVLIDSTCHKFKMFGDFTEEKEYPGILFSNTFWKYRSINNGNSVSVTHYNYHQANMSEAVQDWEGGSYWPRANEVNTAEAPGVEKPKEESGERKTIPSLFSSEYRNMSPNEKRTFWEKLYSSPKKLIYEKSAPEPTELPPII